MSAISNLSGPAIPEPQHFYPVAGDKPFTPVIMGTPGDPLYADPTLPCSLANLTKAQMDNFVNILQNVSKASQRDVNPRTGIMLLLGAMAFPVSAMSGIRPPEGTIPYFMAGLVTLLLGKILVTPPVTELIAKTVTAWKQRLAGPIPSCDMKLTAKAIKKIIQTHQFPNELKDAVTCEKIQDPVVFLDRTGNDKSMTIFERSTALELIQRGMLHPITNRPLNKDELVELPALKRQIEVLSRNPEIKMP